MTGHRSTITTQSSLPVGEHFSLPHHTAADMLVSVMRGNIPDTRLRRVAEQKLVSKFNTHHAGLNRDLGFMAHYGRATAPRTGSTHGSVRPDVDE